MQDAIDKLDEYMARIAKVYDLDQIDDRALTALYEVSLPGSEAVPSLAVLQEWLDARLTEA
jgi:hypothetical protein